MARGLESFAEVRCRGRTREQVRGSAGARGAGKAQAEGAPADRRRHTSGTPGLLTQRPTPVLLLSPLHPPGPAGSGTTLSGSGFQRRGGGGIDKRAGGRRDFRPAVRSDVSRASPRNLFDLDSR